MSWKLRSPGPLKTLLLIGLAIIVAGGVTVAYVVRSVLETRLLAADVAHISTHVRRQYQARPAAIGSAAGAELSAFAAALMQAPDLVRVKIFDAGGRIVWSDEPKLIGRVFGDNVQLARALRGETVAGVVKTTRAEHRYEEVFRRTREIYLPVGPPGAPPAGVVEVYLDAAPFERQVRSAELTLLPTVIAVSLVLYGLLAAAVWRASVSIARSRARERAQVEARVQLVERLRAFGEIAAGATHDLANVFAVLSGRVQLLLGAPDLPPRLKAALGSMERSATDGIDITRRLREIRRTDGDKAFEAVSLTAVARDAIDITRPRWREFTNVEVIPALNDVPAVFGRPGELREVLTNLMLNALDAMPQGGRLTITTGTQDGRVVVEVADTGVGMPDEVRRKLFTPFFTTKPHGTGLGLSVSYGIVKRHGGAIEVESAEGRGTRFIVTLPAAAI